MYTLLYFLKYLVLMMHSMCWLYNLLIIGYNQLNISTISHKALKESLDLLLPNLTLESSDILPIHVFKKIKDAWITILSHKNLCSFIFILYHLPT